MNKEKRLARDMESDDTEAQISDDTEYESEPTNKRDTLNRTEQTENISSLTESDNDDNDVTEINGINGEEIVNEIEENKENEKEKNVNENEEKYHGDIEGDNNDTIELNTDQNELKDKNRVSTNQTIKLLTPRSKTKKDMAELALEENLIGPSKIIRKKINLVRKRLLTANTLSSEVRPMVRMKKTKNIRQPWKGNSSKYRCSSALSKLLGVGRKKITTLGIARKTKDNRIKKEAVARFLIREDNSSLMPGKKDTKTENSQQQQKHVLTDYMKNLFQKFRFENPEMKLSRSLFYSMRPANIVSANFASRRSCLCSRHQNLALKLRALIAAGVKCSKNPDEAIKKKVDLIQQTAGLEKQEFTYKVWKKVQEGDKYRHREVEEVKEKLLFLNEFENQLDDFEEHVKRVKHQYEELRKLRENLAPGNVVVWMDFAENYICSSFEEVQSAYWNASMVSLHTMVVYYRNAENETDNGVQCYVAVSGVLSHNAISVYTILSKLIPELKTLVPNLKQIHYLTDSPTSQYRNKTIFRFISTHKEEYDIEARWNYLESGHGKGPCDGLGASIKRSADNAIKHGKANIQNAADFYQYATKTTEEGSKVKYMMYTQEDYDEAKSILDTKPQIQAIPGTFKIHYVVAVGKMEIQTRHVSCYCENCIEDITQATCEGYTKHKLTVIKKNSERQNRPVDVSTNSNVEIEHEKDDNEHISVTENELAKENDWVAAIYEGKWYVGQVKEIDPDDGEYFIDFFEHAGRVPNRYQEEKRSDVWIQPQKIIKVLSGPPTKIGSRGRSLKIPDIEFNTIDNIFIRRGQK